MKTVINEAKQEMNDGGNAKGPTQLSIKYQAWRNDVSGMFGNQTGLAQ